MDISRTGLQLTFRPAILLALFHCLSGEALGENWENSPRKPDPERIPPPATPTEYSTDEDPNVFRKQILKEPKDHEKFFSVVNKARAAFQAAGNDQFAGGAARAIRGAELCKISFRTSTVVRNWVGQVRNRSTNNKGKGVLGVVVGDDIIVKTWNNSISGPGDGTLIEPTSPVYAAMLLVREGEWVRFSGRFFVTSRIA